MQSTRESYAYVVLACGRYVDATVRLDVLSELPGVDKFQREFYASLREPDEVFAVKADFHNEWRSWGNLLDCVLDDWAGAQMRLWEPGPQK